LEDLKKWVKRSQISFILHNEYADDPNSGWYIGFNRYKTAGYIDDGSDWGDDDVEKFQDVIANLRNLFYPMEIGSFTYELQKDVEPEEARRVLLEYGFTEQKPGWIK